MTTHSRLQAMQGSSPATRKRSPTRRRLHDEYQLAGARCPPTGDRDDRHRYSTPVGYYTGSGGSCTTASALAPPLPSNGVPVSVNNSFLTAYPPNDTWVAFGSAPISSLLLSRGRARRQCGRATSNTVTMACRCRTVLVASAPPEACRSIYGSTPRPNGHGIRELADRHRSSWRRLRDGAQLRVGHK